MSSTWTTTINNGLQWNRTLTASRVVDGVTTPINLTGYTCTARIGSITLTVGAGVTLGGAAGTIALVLTNVQTATLKQGTCDIEIDLVAGDGTSLPRIIGTANIT